MSEASKPWDEEWRGVRDEAGELVLADGKTVAECAEGTAPLIAAAPAMARLLCRLEWSDTWGTVDNGCPCCPRWRMSGHAPDCALDAALSQAGISPEEREKVRQK